MILYLDTNVFFYLTNNKSSFYKICQDFLRYCQDKSIYTTTSVETFQEIIHHAQRTKQLEKGVKIAKESLQLVNQVLSIERTIIDDFLVLVKKYPTVSSRDVLHLSVSLANGADMIITFDKDFSQFKEVASLHPWEFLKRY